MKDITLNFGALRDSISRLASQEILKENSNNSLNSFIDKVKKTPALMKQHLVFKNFEDCKPFTKVRLAERFINQNLEILKSIKWNDILSENRDLRIIMLENTHVESSNSKNDVLYNNIQTLIESVTNPGYSDIRNSQVAYEYMISHLTRTEKKQSLEESENPRLVNWEFITKMAVNNFNERYEHLEESDKKIFSMLISDPNKKKNYIEDLRNENLELIKDILKENSNVNEIKTLEGFQNKMNTSTIEVLNLDEHIIAYSELNENLQNMKATI